MEHSLEGPTSRFERVHTAPRPNVTDATIQRFTCLIHLLDFGKALLCHQSPEFLNSKQR